MRARVRLLLTAALAAWCVGILGAEDWPQWRGPYLNGLSGETSLPIRWTTTDTVAWRLALPEWSGSTPIVWKDRIFLNVADGRRLELWSIDRNTGRLIWKRHLSDGNHREQKQNMSSPSPVTSGERVYVMTGTGVLTAFDFEGHKLWRRDIQRDYGRFGLYWGYASSPLLYGDALFVQVLHGMKTNDPSYVMRIDGLTGETVWRVERPTDAIRESPDAYTTPALLRVDRRTEIVITGGDVVTGHDPGTGRELWRVAGLNPRRNGSYRIVASPVVLDNMIYAPTRVRPLLALRVDGSTPGATPEIVWSTENGPDVPTPVTDGRYLYVVNDRGIVWVFDAKTGEEVYGRRRIKVGTYSASPVLADGQIYITNESCQTTVFRTGPTFEILSENALEDHCLSSPAVSDGQIFIRTSRYLYAIGERRGLRSDDT